MPRKIKDTGVYSIVNRVNGRVYVGSSSRSVCGRCKGHRESLLEGRHRNRYLQRAWNKYGAGAFEFKVLERCGPDKCVAREQVWIDRLRSADPRYGYNLSPTAGSVRGLKHSAESRAKKSQSAKEQFSTDEGRRKASEAAIRRWSDPEQRSMASMKSRGRKHTPEQRAAASARNKKRYADPLERKKMSDAAKRQWANPEFRAKRLSGYARKRHNRDIPL